MGEDIWSGIFFFLFFCYGCSPRAEVVPDSWNGVESNEEEKRVRMCVVKAADWVMSESPHTQNS